MSAAPAAPLRGWVMMGAVGYLFRPVADEVGRSVCVAIAVARPPEVGGAIWAVDRNLPNGERAWTYARTEELARAAAARAATDIDPLGEMIDDFRWGRLSVDALAELVRTGRTPVHQLAAREVLRRIKDSAITCTAHQRLSAVEAWRRLPPVVALVAG